MLSDYISFKDSLGLFLPHFKTAVRLFGQLFLLQNFIMQLPEASVKLVIILHREYIMF